MSDEDDLLDEVDTDEEEIEEAPVLAVSDIDARRRVESKLEELRLRRMTQDYDFD